LGNFLVSLPPRSVSWIMLIRWTQLIYLKKYLRTQFVYLLYLIIKYLKTQFMLFLKFGTRLKFIFGTWNYYYVAVHLLTVSDYNNIRLWVQYKVKKKQFKGERRCVFFQTVHYLWITIWYILSIKTVVNRIWDGQMDCYYSGYGNVSLSIRFSNYYLCTDYLHIIVL